MAPLTRRAPAVSAVPDRVVSPRKEPLMDESAPAPSDWCREAAAGIVIALGKDEARAMAYDMAP